MNPRAQLEEPKEAEEIHASPCTANLLPATQVMGPCFHDNPCGALSKEKLNFCYQTVLRTIDSCLAKRYSDFDGHTTSNCCHGMALLACNLISSVLQLDLKALYQQGEHFVNELEQSVSPEQLCKWWIPEPLLQLSCLYILGLIKESDPVKGGRTSTKKLKLIAPITTNACNQIAHGLQKRFSNWIAEAYYGYFEEMDAGMVMSGAPLQLWGKYVGSDYIRVDKRGVKYASNLFSMQIAMAHLIRSQAKVALINDILDTSGKLQGRYVVIFQGDGNEAFRVLSSEEMKLLNLFEQDEPVVVFGGCVYSDHLTVDSLSLQMQPWLNQLSCLLLACDVFYPQFFRVVDDPEFNHGSIVPDEEPLRMIMSDYLDAKGVSASDPTLYCATHIYPACLSQVLEVLSYDDEQGLPLSFIPGIKLDTPSVFE
jgi:hypothetical protein